MTTAIQRMERKNNAPVPVNNRMPRMHTKDTAQYTVEICPTHEEERDNLRNEISEAVLIRATMIRKREL